MVYIRLSVLSFSISYVINMGLSKYCLKYFKPTHLPPVIPADKDWNAE